MTPLACRRPSVWRILVARLTAGTVGVAAVAVGCAPSSGGVAPTVPPTSTPQAAVQPSPSPLGRLDQPPVASPGLPAPLVERAVADAAGAAGVTVGEVTIVAVTAREWPDRSLGCPKPGLGYAQVVTPGYLIVVEVRGQRLEYHTDQSQVVRCDS
jgi:hypothetical protein